MIRSERGEKKLDWYIKWAASVLVLLAIIFRAAGQDYQLLDLYFSVIGLALRLWVSLLWEDRALILLNGVGFAILCIGVVKLHGSYWMAYWSSIF